MIMENQYKFTPMLLLLDVYGPKYATNYIFLFIVKSPNIGYIVLACYLLWMWLCLYP
jgi:hypothetical protein